MLFSLKKEILTYVFLVVALLVMFIPSISSAEEISAEATDVVEQKDSRASKPKNNVNESSLITPQAYAGIATLTIFADSSASTIGSSGLNYDLGTHAFITVKNISTTNVTVGKLGSIAPGKTVSIGTWGNKTEHKGLWYNLESYFIYKNSAYKNRVSYSMALDSTSLSTLNTYIKNNDYWSNTTNCSSFASGAWNSVAITSDKIGAGLPNTPKNLANNIKSKWPTQYQTGYTVPYNYVVYYAQGSGTPIKSVTYK